MTLLYWTMGGAALAVVMTATGWWRYAFALFAISPSRMTVARLNLRIEGEENIARVNDLLASFLGGFNQTIAKAKWSAWQEGAAAQPVMFRPFWHEGAAMGYTVRRLFQYEPAAFESDVVRPRPEFRYLYYVGLGFWSGMRNHSPARVMKIVEGLDSLHKYLVFDGYGFKRAFFDHPHDGDALKVLDGLPGYARNAAYQGVGRALYFRYMSAPQLMIEEIRRLGVHAVDAAAGVGLAAVFVNPDRLDVAQDLAREMPVEWRPHFHLGMCFGLKARSINDVEQFERYMGLAPAAVSDAAGNSIRECDRVELLVRSEKRDDAYQQWRQRVTDWMSANISYPIAGVMRRDTMGVSNREAREAELGVRE